MERKSTRCGRRILTTLQWGITNGVYFLLRVFSERAKKVAKHIIRYIEQAVKEDVKRKMVFIGGPRQSGKTTLAKHLCEQAGFDVKKRYLTWDEAEDRANVIR